MAKTLQEIRAEIVDLRRQLLPELNNLSSKAEFELWTDLLATLSFNAQEAQEIAIAGLEERIIANAPANALWYVGKALEFQLGDPLVRLPNGDYGYNILAPTKQIVKFAAVLDSAASGFNLDVKIAKDGVPLTSAEKAQFEAYFELLKIAGTKIRYISQGGDALGIAAGIFTNGLRTDTEIEADVISAINAYLRGLPFNGGILVNEIIAVIKTVEGVTDAVITSLEATPDGGAPVPITRSYVPAAGYFILESNTFTYNA